MAAAAAAARRRERGKLGVKRRGGGGRIAAWTSPRWRERRPPGDGGFGIFKVGSGSVGETIGLKWARCWLVTVLWARVA